MQTTREQLEQERHRCEVDAPQAERAANALEIVGQPFCGVEITIGNQRQQLAGIVGMAVSKAA